MQADRFASIFAALPCGVVATDAQGRIVAANPAVETLLRRRPADWLGCSLARELEQVIADPAQALGWTVALSQALGQGQTTYLDLPADIKSPTSPPPAGPSSPTASGNRPCVSITGVVAPWPDEDTGEPGALAVIHDTAHYRSLAELRTRFLSVIAHELGSPVTNIAAAADLLGRELGDVPAQQRLLHIIQGEAARFRRMIGQFLITSPTVAGTLHLARTVVTLRPLLQRVVQTFSLRWPGRRFILDVPAGLPFVEGDADPIQEVLCNLVDNAVRYSSAGTRIVVAAESQTDRVLLSVTDEGPGIAAGDERHIFEPFFRGQPGRSEEGQGLGLYIARTLVHALGGELWHEPQPGGGCRFCFTLVRAPCVDVAEGGETGGRPGTFD